MKKFSIYIILLFLFTIVLSCEKEPLLYQGEEDNSSGIYFYSVATFTIDRVPLSYRDSLAYSFQNDPLDKTEQELLVPLRTLGKVSDKDREFKVIVSGGTAQEGVDFEPLKETYIVPAGSASASVPIKLYRTPTLQEKALSIDIQLVEHGDFKLLLPALLNIGNNEEMDATKFRVVFSEIILEPSYYLIFAGSYFGDWSVKKFKILNDLMGWRTSDWISAGGVGSPVALGRFSYAANLFKSYLEEQLEANTPVYEDDGVTLMQLGSSYMVDYSGL